MCKEYEIAKSIVKDFVKTRQSFSYEELASDIRKNGGIMRIAPAHTIKRYLDFFETEDLISYMPRDGQYISNYYKEHHRSHSS